MRDTRPYRDTPLVCVWLPPQISTKTTRSQAQTWPTSDVRSRAE